MSDWLFGLAALRLERDADLAELPERVATVMADLLRGVLDELRLTDEQQAAANVIVRRRLSEMRAELEAVSGS